MSELRKHLMLSALTGLVLLGFAGDTSAGTVDVKANIAFERVILLNKHSDVTFGGMQIRSNDQISMGADGNIRLTGKGEVLTPFGSPSVVTLGDSRDQILNFSTGNYTPGQGITSLRAHCTVKGSLGDCDRTPIFGLKENTLFIGMDLTIGDGAGTDAHPPSFDMSVVYQ